MRTNTQQRVFSNELSHGGTKARGFYTTLAFRVRMKSALGLTLRLQAVRKSEDSRDGKAIRGSPPEDPQAVSWHPQAVEKSNVENACYDRVIRKKLDLKQKLFFDLIRNLIHLMPLHMVIKDSHSHEWSKS
ncbi:MAG: hypothetical protein LAT83_08235 [Kiritimatiellae bacterium]|nr:hypothetical protein [Kiritimatiellia bacterium]